MKEVEKILKISGSSQKEPEEIYSLEETKIGTWVDGKPLYRKVIELTNTSRNFSISTTIDNLENVIGLKGLLYQGTARYPLPYLSVTDSNYNVEMGIDINSNVFYFKLGTAIILNQTILIIIEYTKTTE